MPPGLSIMWAGVAVIFLGFAAKWTDRTFGLVQILNQDWFEWVGDWVMRAGVVIAVVGGVVWIAQAGL